MARQKNQSRTEGNKGTQYFTKVSLRFHGSPQLRLK